MDDIFDRLDDAVLSTLRNTVAFGPPSTPEEDWLERFYDLDHDRYDWHDPAWQKANANGGFRHIYLTCDYFMIVSARDYERMTNYPDGSPKRWFVQETKDALGNVIGAYAYRSRKSGEPKTPKTVYAHREILDCLDALEDVDHVNGWGLDNRRENLILGPRVHNNRNTTGNRRKNFHLLPGVEERGVNLKGQKLYGGIRSKRIKRTGAGSVRTYRTKRLWLSQEPANKWYLGQIKRLSKGRVSWAHSPKTVNFPTFPPLMESEPTSSKVRVSAKERRQLANIPF